jgi:hypothetical protein
MLGLFIIGNGLLIFREWVINFWRMDQSFFVKWINDFWEWINHFGKWIIDFWGMGFSYLWNGLKPHSYSYLGMGFSFFGMG